MTLQALQLPFKDLGLPLGPLSYSAAHPTPTPINASLSASPPTHTHTHTHTHLIVFLPENISKVFSYVFINFWKTLISV